MRTIYLIISYILAIISIIPWVTMQANNIKIDFFELVTFGQTGIFAVFLPSLYALLSLFFALLLNKGSAKLFLVICSSLFLFLNAVWAIIGLIMLS